MAKFWREDLAERRPAGVGRLLVPRTPTPQSRDGLMRLYEDVALATPRLDKGLHLTVAGEASELTVELLVLQSENKDLTEDRVSTWLAPLGGSIRGAHIRICMADKAIPALARVPPAARGRDVGTRTRTGPLRLTSCIPDTCLSDIMTHLDSRSWSLLARTCSLFASVARFPASSFARLEMPHLLPVMPVEEEVPVKEEAKETKEETKERKRPKTTTIRTCSRTEWWKSHNMWPRLLRLRPLHLIMRPQSWQRHSDMMVDLIRAWAGHRHFVTRVSFVGCKRTDLDMTIRATWDALHTVQRALGVLPDTTGSEPFVSSRLVEMDLSRAQKWIEKWETHDGGVDDEDVTGFPLDARTLFPDLRKLALFDIGPADMTETLEENIRTLCRQSILQHLVITKMMDDRAFARLVRGLPSLKSMICSLAESDDDPEEKDIGLLGEYIIAQKGEFVRVTPPDPVRRSSVYLPESGILSTSLTSLECNIEDTGHMAVFRDGFPNLQSLVVKHSSEDALDWSYSIYAPGGKRSIEWPRLQTLKLHGVRLWDDNRWTTSDFLEAPRLECLVLERCETANVRLFSHLSRLRSLRITNKHEEADLTDLSGLTCLTDLYIRAPYCTIPKLPSVRTLALFGKAPERQLGKCFNVERLITFQFLSASVLNLVRLGQWTLRSSPPSPTEIRVFAENVCRVRQDHVSAAFSSGGVHPLHVVASVIASYVVDGDILLRFGGWQIPVMAFLNGTCAGPVPDQRRRLSSRPLLLD